jgi:hypothetical protein
MSASFTIPWRRYTLSVRWPVIFMATAWRTSLVEVPHSRSPEIVDQETRYVGGGSRVGPGVPKFDDRRPR